MAGLIAPHAGELVDDGLLAAHDPRVVVRRDGVGVARGVGGLRAVIADAVDRALDDDPDVGGLAVQDS